MAEAEVGDDCYGDDPTVNALEQRVAALLGKEAAVFLPTGTLANQLAVATHTRPGMAVACHPGAHVRIHEDASAAALSGVQLMPIGTREGYTVADLEALCAEEACGWPRVGLVWLENTLGDAGGRLWPLRTDEIEPRAERDALEEIGAWARAQGRPVHLDGARLWNAHVATGHSLAAFAEVADSVSVAMSKGLGAPMGSLLCADAAFVARARSRKHAFGGGMRQAGIVAAAGLHALDHHVQRLADDHARARRLAEGIANLRCWTVRPPDTNIVIARVADSVPDAESLCRPLREAGVLCHPNRAREVRFVVHLGIDDAAIDAIVATIERVHG